VASDESKELVQRASRGDAVAVDVLLERHLPGLRKYVRLKISPALLAKESSSDVVQSVCREVLEGFEQFEYQGEAAFRNWLYQAAVRKLVDHLRYHEAQKRDVQPIPASTLSSAEFALLASSLHSPSKDAMMNEEVESLERGFARLARADQEILRMVYIEGLSHAQVAEQLECTEVSSRKQLSRALARLARNIR
jgi:RNA polymerase sigma-70 factor (ECF subfamily)